jgi:nitrous-oxide reductase
MLDEPRSRGLLATATALLLAVLLAGCGGGDGNGGAADVSQIAQDRDLSQKDLAAAARTYVPSGDKDEYLMFTSGGQSGQVMVWGVPSMRLLKVIGVFTPEPWQGYAYGAEETEKILDSGNMNRKDLEWGDTHHPALSETDGDYDGEYLFINDKANPRVGLIDLRDFETKQIVPDPLMTSDHGATFVTPNTEYVIHSSQYAGPMDGSYASLDEYEDEYRGVATFFKFDRDAGRIDVDRSFSIELPPYMQDLSDAGKGPSHGWAFINSFNTEMATGGIGKGNPPFEAGTAANDMDYLHIINWEKAAEVARDDANTETIQGRTVIPLDVAVEEGLLYFAPEPKSPHGVDVSPDGSKIVVSGKLDPHNTVYSWEKIQQAIENENFSGTDDYGVPILSYDAIVDGQLELGLGPLHTQFANDSIAYTSLFIASQVVKWDIENLEIIDKAPVHYNVGHLAASHGDTKNPRGDYVVALNKWAIDRFANVGPLHPQNFQLFDGRRQELQLLYDAPVGLGEPHYGQIIETDLIDSWKTYPEVGYDPARMAVDPEAPTSGEERIERRGNEVHVYMTAVRSHFNPEHIEVQEGDEVVLHVTNVEQARDATHGFAINEYNVNLSLEPGEAQTVRFTADQPGVFPFYCTEFCSALHLEMQGYLLVEPEGGGQVAARSGG